MNFRMLIQGHGDCQDSFVRFAMVERMDRTRHVNKCSVANRWRRAHFVLSACIEPHNGFIVCSLNFRHGVVIETNNWQGSLKRRWYHIIQIRNIGGNDGYLPRQQRIKQRCDRSRASGRQRETLWAAQFSNRCANDIPK